MNPLRRVAPGGRWQPSATRENAWSQAAEQVLGSQFNQRKGFPSSIRGWFFAKIGASPAQDGSNKRWKYAWSEVVKEGAGYGGWVAISGGRSGTTSTNPAYNFIEEGNGASGLFGNGVNSSNLTGTFDIQPFPANRIVVMYVVGIEEGDPEFWFGVPNGVDGGCGS